MTCNPKSLGVLFGALLCIAVFSSEASADPLFFSNVRALQNSGLTSVDLNANPNATLFGSQINFLVDISGVLPQNGIDILSITYTEQGSASVTQTFQIPLFGSVNPPFSLQFAINPTNPSALGTPATLTIDLLNSAPDFVTPGGQQVNSRTYAFNVASPVPEPSSLVLFASAAVAGLGGLRRKLRKR